MQNRSFSQALQIGPSLKHCKWVLSNRGNRFRKHGKLVLLSSRINGPSLKHVKWILLLNMGNGSSQTREIDSSSMGNGSSQNMGIGSFIKHGKWVLLSHMGKGSFTLAWEMNPLPKHGKDVNLSSIGNGSFTQSWETGYVHKLVLLTCIDCMQVFLP